MKCEHHRFEHRTVTLIVAARAAITICNITINKNTNFFTINNNYLVEREILIISCSIFVGNETFDLTKSEISPSTCTSRVYTNIKRKIGQIHCLLDYWNFETWKRKYFANIWHALTIFSNWIKVSKPMCTDQDANCPPIFLSFFFFLNIFDINVILYTAQKTFILFDNWFDLYIYVYIYV